MVAETPSATKHAPMCEQTGKPNKADVHMSQHQILQFGPNLFTTSSGPIPRYTTPSSRKTFRGAAYRDRAAPRLAPAKLLLPAFVAGLFIEPAPGSNCPGRILSAPSVLAARFFVFCAAFAFALWRALSLVMSSSPSTMPFGTSSPLPRVPHYTPTSTALASAKLLSCDVRLCPWAW